MKILVLINKWEREVKILQKIKEEIEALNSEAQVTFIQRYEKDYLSQVIELAPQIVLTYPLTAFPESSDLYLIKYFLKCFVICFRTEGILNFSSKKHLAGAVGLDRYGEDLVDYELVWGRKAADFLARGLLENKKIASPVRVKSFGYPNYEVYFQKQAMASPKLPAEMTNALKKFRKNKVIFFVTGFALADYSREDLIRAGDLFDANRKKDFQSELKRVSDISKALKNLRNKWIDNIIEIAKRHYDLLIIVKSHPTENIINHQRGYNPYHRFQSFTNIVYLSEPVDISDIMKYSGLFFHYGSTAAAEAYLLQVPSVLISSEGLFDDYGWPSNRVIDISQLSQLVAGYIDSPLQFRMTSEIEKILYDAFNISKVHLAGREGYSPSSDIARFLIDLKHDSPQPIDSRDPFLFSAVKRKWFRLTFGFLTASASNLFSGNFSRSRSSFSIVFQTICIYLKNLAFKFRKQTSFINS